MELDGKVAIVTGASRGVGAATAVALAGQGARVACAARATDSAPMSTPGTLDATVRDIRSAGGDAIAVPTNLGKDEEVVAMVAKTIDHYGRVDILVNNAAITFPGDLDTPMKRYDLMFAVNLRAPLIACQQVAPGMKERGEGSILNVSSMAALNYFPGLMAYGMSKIALEHMTVSLATQLAPFDIAVNTFRIDIAVASEGFVANMPDADHANWEPTEVPAEGILWMLRQPPSYTGRNEAMSILRETRGIMKSRVAHPTAPSPGTNRVNPMPFLDPTGAPVTGVEA
jgi:NAD(P)-dependent dehydrogenase (short-subunit alcohol dehydrogenase family)